MNRRGFFGRMLAGLVATKLPLDGALPVLPGTVEPVVPPVATRTVAQSAFVSYYGYVTQAIPGNPAGFEVVQYRHTPPLDEWDRRSATGSPGQATRDRGSYLTGEAESTGR